MLSSSIFNSNQFRFGVATLLAVLGLLGTDYWLFHQKGFLHSFGQATQEGQVLSKLERAEKLAPYADVILFGSSYVRSGISSRPFYDHGVLPLNFGITGAGPVFAYLALEKLAPFIEARDDKPTLFLELKAEALLPRKDTAWSEYEQWTPLIRSRSEVLRYFGPLYSSLRDYGISSHLLSHLIFPSGFYRTYNQALLFGGRLDGFFYGVEDSGGFSPLYTVRGVPFETLPRPNVSSKAINPGKLDFIHRFLARAKELGCPVVLFESASQYGELWYGAYDVLISEIQKDYPDIRFIQNESYDMQLEDFDLGGHPNLWGADKLAKSLIQSIRADFDRGAFDSKVASVFDVVPVPGFREWELRSKQTVLSFDPELRISQTRIDYEDPLLLVSPLIPVIPRREYVLEMAVQPTQGRIRIEVQWENEAPSTQSYAEGVSQPPDLNGRAQRVFVRFRPTASFLTVRIFGIDDGQQQESIEARVRPIRLVGYR